MRVAVVCKDPLLRDGIISLMLHEGAFDVIGGDEHVADVITAYRSEPKLLVLAVADMMDTDDWVQLNQVKADGQTKIILIVSGATSTVGQRVADMVVRRSEGSGALIQILRRFVGPAVYNRNGSDRSAVFEPAVSSYGSPRSLTKRELEVAQLVAQGMPNRRIAAVLQLQEQSIKNLVSSVMRKLDCENRVQVALRLSGRPSPSARRMY